MVIFQFATLVYQRGLGIDELTKKIPRVIAKKQIQRVGFLQYTNENWLVMLVKQY